MRERVRCASRGGSSRTARSKLWGQRHSSLLVHMLRLLLLSFAGWPLRLLLLAGRAGVNLHTGLHLSLRWSLLHLLLLHRRTPLSRHEGLHGIERLPVTRPCATDL